MKREIKQDMKDHFPGLTVETIDISRRRGIVSVSIVVAGDADETQIAEFLGSRGCGYADKVTVTKRL